MFLPANLLLLNQFYFFYYLLYNVILDKVLNYIQWCMTQLQKYYFLHQALEASETNLRRYN